MSKIPGPRDKRDLSLYRPNAGVVLFNKKGRVWLGHRKGEKGKYTWQFPQGGMDKGEDHEEAALRELYEETGVTRDKLEKLGEIEDWLAYDFPPDVLKQKAKNWNGQKQRWFAYLFLGKKKDFDLKAVPPQEFDDFEWVKPKEAVKRIIDWKRPVYAAVIEEFKPITKALRKK